MFTTEIRSLSSGEIDMVSGGVGTCIHVDDNGKATVLRCEMSVVEAYINAFLDGVEQGKQKGKQKQ